MPDDPVDKAPALPASQKEIDRLYAEMKRIEEEHSKRHAELLSAIAALRAKGEKTDAEESRNPRGRHRIFG